MYSKYQMIKILENCFQNVNCFSWIKLIPVVLYLKYWCYNSPYLQLACLPHHLCQMFHFTNWNPLQHNPHHVFHRFLYFVLTNWTTSHHKYWIYQTISKANPINFIIKLYKDHNVLWVKHATHKKAESLRAASLLKFDNMVNSDSIFNAKYAKLSAK